MPLSMLNLKQYWLWNHWAVFWRSLSKHNAEKMKSSGAWSNVYVNDIDSVKLFTVNLRWLAIAQFADLFFTKCFNKGKFLEVTNDSKIMIYIDDKKRRCFLLISIQHSILSYEKIKRFIILIIYFWFLTKQIMNLNLFEVCYIMLKYDVNCYIISLSSSRIIGSSISQFVLLQLLIKSHQLCSITLLSLWLRYRSFSSYINFFLWIEHCFSLFLNLFSIINNIRF